jgi:hypothetical protein
MLVGVANMSGTWDLGLRVNRPLSSERAEGPGSREEEIVRKGPGDPDLGTVPAGPAVCT